MSTTFLCVCANEATKNKAEQLKFLFNNPTEITLEVTDNEAFLENKLVASFDYVMICLFDDHDVDFEMQMDFFQHYMNAPVSGYFSTMGNL